MKLIIVESPTKTHTIKEILGDEYTVLASKGHIRDLSTKGRGGLGIDLENDFKPTYVIQDDKREVVKELIKAKEQAEEVILATDPDREGEAISWHIAEVLKLPVKTTKRLEFHEVTESAIKKAIENPRTIDINLVASQETRRIIDRIIGFKLSTLLKSKIKSRSAGRVQSVTLRCIVEKEKEINKFVQEEYYTITGKFLNNKIEAILKGYKDETKEIKYVEKEIQESDENLDVSKVKIKSLQEANDIIKSIPEKVVVSSFDTKDIKREPKPPFTTSTMQQYAFSIFGFSTKKTQAIAQKLYEGIKVDGKFKGLVTYIRTDSVNLSEEFVEKAKNKIIDEFGKEYVGHEQTIKSKQKVQNAHEAIRPSDLSFTPAMAKKHLTKDEYSLYKLIYTRAVASLMAPKIEQVTTLSLNGNNYIFEAKSSQNKFDGYSKLYGEYETYSKDTSIPQFEIGQEITKDELKAIQHFTKAPSRYTEGRIVKLMEEKGIGRPSTYGSTISTLSDRKYITIEDGTIHPTEQGCKTVDELVEYFNTFMDIDYTAKLENDLDEVVAGGSSRSDLLNNFCHTFFPLYDYAKTHMTKLMDTQTGDMCPVCGKPLVIKQGKYGSFVACSGFPSCKYIVKDEPKQLQETGEFCPLCGSPLVVRKNRRGQEFIGCSSYPKCTYIKAEKKEQKVLQVIKQCPECGGDLVVRQGRGKKKFLGCTNYPRCKYNEPYDEKSE